MKLKMILTVFLLLCLGMTRIQAQEVEIIPVKKFTHFFLSGISVYPSHTAYSISIGNVKKFGWYAKVKSNFNFDTKYDYLTYSENSEVFWNGNTKRGLYSADLGLVWNVSRPLLVYCGGGYGQYWQNGVTISNQQIRLSKYSAHGFNGDSGILISVNRFLVCVGANIIDFDYIGADFSLGFKF